MPPALRPKILFLTRSLDIGGAQRQLVELAGGLHHAGWCVKVVTFYGGGALEAELLSKGIQPISLEKASRWDVIRFMARLAELLRSEKPDIVHGYLEVANILLVLLRRTLPNVRVVWGMRASYLEARHYDMLSRAEELFGAALSRFADLIICNSHAGFAHYGRSGYLRDRMIVIPNGIDLHRFQPDRAARDEVRKEWAVAPDERLIGLVGRLDQQKDPPNFLRAAARLAALHPRVKFAVVGDGAAAYRDELMREAHALGLDQRLIWSPARTDVSRIYNGLDILVSASAFGEGFSNTVAEAMASGVPCVVTNVGDSASIVGDSGWVCEAHDTEALTRTISAALDALPLDAERIRRRIAMHFSSAELVRRSAVHLAKLVEPACAAVADA